MNHDLKKLTHQARMVGCQLFVGDRIKLITYDRNGKTNKTYHYDYVEPDHIKNIKHRLDEMAKPLRKQWGGDFLELGSVAFSLGFIVEIGDYSAFLVKTVENPSVRIPTMECAFSSAGLHRMSDYLATALINREAPDNTNEEDVVEEKEEESIMEEVKLTRELARVIAVMYYRMSPAEQQGIRDSADVEVNRIINKALKLSAEN